MAVNRRPGGGGRKKKVTGGGGGVHRRGSAIGGNGGRPVGNREDIPEERAAPVPRAAAAGICSRRSSAVLQAATVLRAGHLPAPAESRSADAPACLVYSALVSL